MATRQPIFVSITEAAEQLGVSPAWLKQEVGSGVLPSITVGTRVRVDVELLRLALARHSSDSDLAALLAMRGGPIPFAGGGPTA